MSYVYRPPPQYSRPQIYRARPYEPYTLRWLYDRATQQYIVLGTLSGTAVPSLINASPAIASGDIWVTPLVTDPSAYNLTIYATGDYTIDSGGDTSRQSFAHNVYDLSLASFYGEGTHYDGNLAPQISAPFFNGAIYKKDEDQGTIDISVAWSDPEGDSIAFDVSAGALPTGWNLASNGQITGTPTVYGTYTPTFRGTDSPPGDSSTSLDTIVIGDEVPNVAGQAEAAAIAAIEAVANFTVASPSLEAYSSSVPLGSVISYEPSGYAADNAVITLTVSLGPEPEDEEESTGGLNKRRRRYLVQVDGQTFQVSSKTEAIQVLERAKALAIEHAEQLAKVSVPTRKTGGKPAKLPTPKISSPDPELKSVVSEVRKEINATYRRAAMEAEIAYLMAKKAEQDDEDDILLLI